MLNAFSYFHLISKAGSFGTKLFTLGLTGFGLKKLWSQDTSQRHSFSTRVMFSGTYILHMGATCLATATLFDMSPISTSTATVLVGATTLLTCYSNLLDSYISRSLSKIKYSALEKKLKMSRLDLERSNALIQGVNECNAQVSVLKEEIKTLKTIQSKLEKIKALPTKKKIKKLLDIYKNLENTYLEKTHQREIIVDFFKENSKKSFDANNALKEIDAKIDTLKKQAIQLKYKLKHTNSSKTKARLNQNLNKNEQALVDSGIIHVQCIRYKKINDAINQLTFQLQYHEQQATNETPLAIQGLKARIKSLNSSLDDLKQLDQTDKLDLEIGITAILSDKIKENPDQFATWLLKNIDAYIQAIELKIKNQEENAKDMQACFKLFIKTPKEEIQDHFIYLRQITHSLADLKTQLSVETWDKNSNRTKMNFSIITSAFTISLSCFPLANDTSNILKILALGVGLFSGANGLWNFYQKNLLIKKNATKVRVQKQCVDKELAFKRATEGPTIHKIITHSYEASLRKTKTNHNDICEKKHSSRRFKRLE